MVYRDNTPQRFEAYGWPRYADVDGHDPVAIKAAIESRESRNSKAYF